MPMSTTEPPPRAARAHRLKADDEASNAWGWILEMYAFSIACATAPGGPIDVDVRFDFAVQPPFDPDLTWHGKPVYIIHYTYGACVCALWVEGGWHAAAACVCGHTCTGCRPGACDALA